MVHSSHQPARRFSADAESSRGLRQSLTGPAKTVNRKRLPFSQALRRLAMRKYFKGGSPSGRLADRAARSHSMCRNIKTLFNFDPPVTDEEVRAASLQFVRKITGFNQPSKANEAAFVAAVDEIAGISARLLHSLDTTVPPKNREEEAAKAKARAAERFGA